MGPFTLDTIRDKYQPLHLSAGTANTSMWWRAVHKSVRWPNEWSGLSGSVAHIGSKQREWWKEAGGGASPTLPQSEPGNRRAEAANTGAANAPRQHSFINPSN